MIAITLTNEMLNRIISIENCKSRFTGKRVPARISARLRKLSRKKSAHSSTAIEGNPLDEQQVSEAIDSSARHFLKPEEEVRNYYAALELLDEKLERETPFSKELVLEVQELVVKGESREKAEIRGPMPPGVLFAVYDSATGKPEYIPPEAADIEPLLLNAATNRPRTLEIRMGSSLLNQSFIAQLQMTFARYPGRDNVDLLVEQTNGATLRAEIPLHVDARNIALQVEVEGLLDGRGTLLVA